MGKKGSVLIPFLLDGLRKTKYGEHLVYLPGELHNIFKITLPRKSKNLQGDSMKILMDWYELRHQVNEVFEYTMHQEKEVFEYTKAKQGMVAALRKSVYLESLGGHKYEILSSEKVNELDAELREECQYFIQLDELSEFCENILEPVSTEAPPEISANLKDLVERKLMDDIALDVWFANFGDILVKNELQNVSNSTCVEAPNENNAFLDNFNLSTLLESSDNTPMKEVVQNVSEPECTDAPNENNDIYNASFMEMKEGLCFKSIQFLDQTAIVFIELKKSISQHPIILPDAARSVDYYLHEDIIKKIQEVVKVPFVVTQIKEEANHLLFFVNVSNNSIGNQ